MPWDPWALRPSRRAFLVGLAGVAIAACSDSNGSSRSSDRPTSGDGSSSGAARPQWPMYGHDFAQTRANVAETVVDATSVARLAVVWEIPDLVGVTGTPVVVDDVAYFSDWRGQTRAVQAATGEVIWTAPVGGMIVGAPAVDGDRVYVATGATLFCLDRTTGAELWQVKTDEHPQAQISASPVVVDDIVLQGTASFENFLVKDEYLFRGSIGGYDTATGEQRWKFYSTPGDDTAGAGAGIWSTPAVDTERGLLYVGTGQGLSEPTPPMADSIVAVDYRTGELRWATQFTYPDVFSAGNPTGKDADVGASPNLWTADGQDLVGAGDKGGTFHTLDRDSGEIVWETQLTPGSAFGGEIGSAAFVDDTLIASSNVGDPETNAPTNVTHVFGLDPATGEKRWTADELAGNIFAPVGAVPGVAFVGTAEGQLLALATDTGEQLWTYDAPAKTACGPSIVDGRVLWGYGFVLFGGPGPGGLLAFEVG